MNYQSIREWAVNGGLLVTCVAAILAAGVLISALPIIRRNAQYNGAREAAVSAYADTNHDNKITLEERAALHEAVCRTNGAVIIPDGTNSIKYADNGTDVPREVQTQWYRNFKPK